MKNFMGCEKAKVYVSPLNIAVITLALFEIYFLFVALRVLFACVNGYCAASGSTEGLSNLMLHNYQTWSGGVIATIWEYLFIGLPAWALPFGFGGLMAVFTAVGLLVFTILTSFFKPDSFYETVKSKFASLAVASIFIFAAWSAYWWVPYYFSQLSFSTEKHFSYGIVYWQVVNFSYVALPLVGLAFVEGIITKKITNPFLVVVSGILLGSLGYIVAITLLAFLAIDLSTRFRMKSQSKKGLVSPFLFSLSAVAFLFFSNYSSGSLITNEELRNTPDFRPTFFIVAKNLSSYVEIVFSLSSAIAVLSGAIVYAVHKRFNGDTKFSTSAMIFGNSQRFLTLSILAFFILKISRIFSFGEYYSEYPSGTYLFLSLMGFGATISSRLHNYHVKFSSPLFLIATLSTVTLYMFSFYTMSQSVLERATESEKGYYSTAVVDVFNYREFYGSSTSWLILSEKI